MSEKKTWLCRSHPDFHIPADVDVGEDFDGDALGRRLKECGTDSIAIFGKCHYGHAYYPTKIGTPHPRLKKDILREAVDGCSRHGVAVVVYYSVFLDTCAAVKHPEWRVKSSDTGANAGFDSGRYTKVCVNSGYIEELLVPQSLEIVNEYEVDEILYDTMTGFQPCYCEKCRALFGRKIPGDDKDPLWPEYVRWYAERFDSFFADTALAVRRVNPKVGVVFNWKWGIREPCTPPENITALCADLWCSGTIASRHCRYFAGTDLPYHFMTGRFLHGLGDWDSTTPESLLYTASATIANGGGFYIIDRMLPDGTLEERSYDVMRDTFSFIQKRRPWVEGTRHVPETAMLYSYASLVGPAFERFALPEERKMRMQAVEGASRLLTEHARHFTVLSEEALCEKIGEYRCVIVPEQEILAPETVEAIDAYARSGGRVLLSQPTFAENADLYTYGLAGVRCEGLTELEYGYVGVEPPFHVRGRFARVVPEDARELYACVEPLDAGDGGKRFGHGFAPPHRKAEFPAVTVRRLGKGSVAYIAAPIFRACCNHESPHIAKLVFELLDMLLPEPMVRVSTRAQVEMSMVRKGDDLIVHLVNHSGRERVSGWVFPVTEYIPEIRNIPVAIKIGKRKPKMRFVPEGKDVKYKEKDGYAHLKLPKLEVMASIEVKGYFKSA